MKKKVILLIVSLILLLGSLYLVFGARSPLNKTIDCTHSRIHYTYDDSIYDGKTRVTSDTTVTIEYNIVTRKVLSFRGINIQIFSDNEEYLLFKQLVQKLESPMISFDDYKRSVTTINDCNRKCKKELRHQTLRQFKETFRLQEERGFICR